MKKAEIIRQKEMLDDAGIPYEYFEDDFFSAKGTAIEKALYPSYQIRLNDKVDVIQHLLSHGYSRNLLEICEGEKVEGFLTAAEVFNRFKYHYETSMAKRREERGRSNAKEDPKITTLGTSAQNKSEAESREKIEKTLNAVRLALSDIEENIDRIVKFNAEVNKAAKNPARLTEICINVEKGSKTVGLLKLYLSLAIAVAAYVSETLDPAAIN